MCRITSTNYIALNENRFVEEKLLGTGEISKVLLATDTKTQQKVAIKKINKKALTPNLQRKLVNEVTILKNLSTFQDSYFLKLYDAFEDDENIYLVTEYIPGGELFDLVSSFSYGVPEVLCVSILRQIFTAITQLHKLDFAHLDLKLENIMYNPETGRIKIIDFGYASPTESKLQEFSGSIHYIAPQLLHKTPYDGKKADVWSLGIIAYAMLAAKFPFDDENDNQSNIFFKIRQGIFSMPPHFSSHAKSFVTQILNPNENKRPFVEEMLQHPFLWSQHLAC